MANARALLGRLSATAVLIGILAAPSVALIWVLGTTSDELSELEPEVQAVVTLPSEVVAVDRRPVIVEATFSEPSTVLSPGLSGTVTAVFVGEGSLLQHLTPILEIDGVTRVGVVSESPFHRPLRYGSDGPDVLALEQMLSDSGFFADEPNERFNYTTKSAVKAFEDSIGVDKPTGEFYPHLVVWLPQPDTTLVSFTPRMGAPGPGIGEPIGASEHPLVSVRLLDVAGVPVSDLEPGRYELRIENALVGTVDDASSLGPAISGVLESRVPRPEATDPVDGVSSTTTVRGEVQLIQPVRTTAVPSSAVVTNISGDGFCVWIREEGARYRAASVSVVGGSLGVAEVAESFESDTEILANPLAILDSAACP